MEIKLSLRHLGGVLLIAAAILNGFGGSLPFRFDSLPVPPFGQTIELKDAWFVVIEESSERPAWLAALVLDEGMKTELASKNANWLLLDKDSPDAAPYVAKAGGLPGYVLINGDQKVVSYGKLPETRDGILALVK